MLTKKSSSIIKKILIITILVAAAMTLAFVRGRMLVVRNYSVPGHSSGGVKIVGLADLHGEMVGEKQERIVQEVREADPDFIVYLGDMVERTRAEESVEPLVVLTEQLVQIAPVYYVDGNHELDVRKQNPDVYRRLNEELSDLGAVQLKDEIVSFTVDSGTVVNLCGITRHYYWGDFERELAGKLKKMDGVNVLACHYPEAVIWYDAFDGGGLDAALCGHTHGGLIRVPFLGGMVAPEQSRWPKYDLGAFPVYTDTTWSEYGGGEDAEYLGTMIISGGLAGEHGVPRVNNPMEVSVVEVE